MRGSLTPTHSSFNPAVKNPGQEVGAAAGQAAKQGLLFYYFFHLGVIRNQSLEGVAKTNGLGFRALEQVH